MTECTIVERITPGIVQHELWQEHINRYNFVLRLVPNKFVLDVACGTGYGAELISRTANLAIGVDVSREALIYANQHYGNHHNIGFVLSDACHLPFRDNTFDVVVSFETIEHLHYPEIFLQRIACVLKMNETLIVSTPNGQIYSQKQKPSLNSFHFREFNIKDFSQLLSTCFVNIEFYGQNFSTTKMWLLQFLGERSPLSFKILIRKLNKIFFKQSIPQKKRSSKADTTYSVKKIVTINPFCSPHFFIAVVKNRKPNFVN